MAELTTTRVGLIRYGAGTDMLSRVDYNTAVDALEEKVAIDEDGVGLPLAGIRGRWFTNTSTGVQYRDSGSGWLVVGTNLRNSTIKPLTTGAVALTIQGLTDQTGELVKIKNAIDTELFVLDAGGTITTRASRIVMRGNPALGEHIMSLTASSNEEEGLQIVIPDTSTRSFIETKLASGATTFSVNYLGRVTTDRLITNQASVQGTVNDVTTLNFATGSLTKLDFSIGAGIGTHTGGLPYFRSASGFYFYNGGVHSATAGDPGAGGVLSFSVGGFGALYGNNTAHFKGSIGEPTLDTSVYGVTVGPLDSNNTIYGKGGIQSRINGAAQELKINRFGGGNVLIGDSALSSLINLRALESRVNGTNTVLIKAPAINTEGSVAVGLGEPIANAFKINGFRLHIGDDEPEDPEVGDIWIEI